MLSVGAICFEDRSCASKKRGIGGGGIGGGEWAVMIWRNMVAVLASCRTALVSTGWTISLLVSKNEHRKHSSHWGTISGSMDIFSHAERSLVKEP